jgi:hypothetical protein
MSASGTGLLENDDAATAIHDVIRPLGERIAAALKVKKRDDAGTLAAQLGLLAHYYPHVVSWPDNEEKPSIEALRRVVRSNRAALDFVAPRARPVLDAIEQSKPISPEPCIHLIRAKHARGYLQGLADELVDSMDRTVRDSTDAFDMGAGGYLDILRLIATQIEVPEGSVRRWAAYYRNLRARGRDPDFVYEYVEACRTLMMRTATDDR